MGTQPYWRLGRGLNPLAISRLADNPISTARLKTRWASGAADMGLRKRDSNPRHQTRVRRLSHGEQPPLRFGAITCELRPIEIGVTNRIRTGTNAYTGRDAAVTS